MINLNCEAAGCQNGPYVPPVPEFSTLAIVLVVVAGVGVLFVVVGTLLPLSPTFIGTSFFAYSLIQKRREQFLPVYHGLHDDIQLSLSWDNISCSIGKRQVLYKIAGVALPGQITAILGPSGKTDSRIQ